MSAMHGVKDYPSGKVHQATEQAVNVGGQHLGTNRLQADSPLPGHHHGGQTAKHSTDAGQHGKASNAQGGAVQSTGAGPRTHIGVADEQGMRSYMEDRHTAIADFKLEGGDPSVPRQFVAVYDGHSSHHGSEHASRRLHEIIAGQPAVQQTKGDASDYDKVEAALKAAFEDVDEEIIGAAVKGGKRYGTTAVCAMRIGNALYVAHAGDSRAVLAHDGKGKTLTQDHKPASVPEERARIEAAGGKVSESADRVVSNPEGKRHSRLNMSRALGDPDFKQPRRLVESEPDVIRVDLTPADSFLLLGSDGLFDVMSAQEAVDEASRVLQKSGGPSSKAAEAAAEALVKKALDGGTSDNVTALVMAFEWSGAAEQ